MTGQGVAGRGRGLTVVNPGVLTTVQDLGRPGWAHLGVARGGAADRGALRLGNRLVANDEGAAGLEVLLGGLELRAGRSATVAVTGGRGPVTVDGRPEPDRAVLTMPEGGVLKLGECREGLRRYLAVRGGIDVPPVLGSRSYDRLAGLGPEPLAKGDVLDVGSPPDAWPVTDVAPARTDTGPLDAVPGPRDDLVGDAVMRALEETEWAVDPRSDRVGVRLEGPPLPVDPGSAHVPSEATVRGAVQLPPDGRPVLFGADHPTTGGYPVVAVLTASAADRAAQLRPGDSVRIRLRPRPGWSTRY